jgi:hypothetical protein
VADNPLSELPGGGTLIPRDLPLVQPVISTSEPVLPDLALDLTEMLIDALLGLAEGCKTFFGGWDTLKGWADAIRGDIFVVDAHGPSGGVMIPRSPKWRNRS